MGMKSCLIVLLFMMIVALPLFADLADTNNWAEVSPEYAVDANMDIWEVVPGIVREENVQDYKTQNGWGLNIEADKGAHFTAFAGAEILIDWFLIDYLKLDVTIPGTNINLWKIVAPAILMPMAFITENNMGVKNIKDSYADLYGIAFGATIRLL